MMKKILLGLGTVSISILPIVAIASCSSTSNPAPTLEAEVTKFNKSFETKDKTLTTLSVTNNLNKEVKQIQKLELLKTFVDLPLLTNGFNLTIGSSSINQTANSSVDVHLTILDTKADKTSDTILTITNLVSVTATLETEAGKFGAPVRTTKPGIMASEAVQTITNASGAAAKLKALEAFANVPKIDKAFELEVKSAAVGLPVITNADIKITIKEKATPANTKEVTLVVTNFAAAAATLETEAGKFNAPVKTTKPLIMASDAVQTITNANGAAAKLKALEAFANVPKIDNTFELEVKSAAVGSPTTTNADIKITIKEKATPANTKEVTLVVTNFSSGLISTEAAKFTTRETKDTKIVSSAAIIDLIKANDNNAKLTVLNSLVDVPTIDKQFWIEIKGVQFTPGNNRSIQLSLAIRTVKEVPGINSVDVNFTITGFAQPSGPENGHAVLYIKSQLLNDRKVLPAKANETALAASKILVSTEALNTYYALTNLGDGATYRWIETTVSGNTLVVQIGIRNSGGSQGIAKNIVISGFKPAA